MRTARALYALFLLSLGLAALAARPLPGNTVYLGATTRAEGVPAALTAHRLNMRAQAQSFDRYRRELIRRRALSPRAMSPQLDSFVISETTRAAQTRVEGDGALAFTFQGWTAAEESILSTFLTRAYTELRDQFIGAPASNSTLLIVKGGLDSGIEGGEFNPDTMTLTIEPLPSDFPATDSTFYGMNLVHLLVHAFHAPALIGFDAWEEGLARATAAVAMMNIRPRFENDLIYDTTYLLPLYDLLNQPALANATFFPATGISQMVYWRMGMAYAAWLKVYAENRTALKNFHNAYYAQYRTNPAVAGNLGALKSLMAAAVPTVEGAAFTDWYQRQYVLQPISTIGKKIYVYPVPLHDNVMLQVYYYQTNAGGTETPLSGIAKLDYTTFDYLQLYPLEGDEIAISSVAVGNNPAGVGYLSPSFFNIGETDMQRIRISTTIDAMRNVTYFPAYTRGDDTIDSPNTAEFYGAIIGANDGTLRIALPGMGQLETPVVQGAISQQLSTGDITFLSPVIFEYVSTGGRVTRFYRNVGPGSYTPILVVDEQTGVLSRTLPAGFSMISFPITPTVTDVATLLGNDAQLAWWDPAARVYRYAPHAAIPAIAPGFGYWVKLPTTRTVQVAGTQPTLDDPRAIVLQPGWNMIGNTYNGPLNPWTMTVESGFTGYRLSDAVQNGIVSPVWTYDAQNGYVVRGLLGGWEGGWIYNPGQANIILRQLGANRATRAVASDDVTPILFDGGWGVALDVRTATTNERLHFGIARQASNGVDGRDWMKPPAMGSRLQAAFIHPGRAIAGAAFATDVRQGVGINGESWEFVVTTPSTETVMLRWPDLRHLPRGYALLLEDVATGTRQYLQSTAAYSYQATGTTALPDTRRFKVTATTGTEPPLRILQMLVQPTRGGGASINVSLSGAADILLDVRTPTGKLVRSLRVPASGAYDSMIIPWDGRASGGKLIPSGTYLLTLTARTQEGYTIRRAGTVSVGRR